MPRTPTTLDEATHANLVLWSEVYPYEIVAKMSDRMIAVREMDSQRDPEWKPDFIPGGFAGHCTNQHEQTWFYEQNLTNPVKKVRLHKDGKWYDKHGNRYSLNTAPVHFYDYNF